MTEPLTPAGLRCRREALGLSRADLGVLLDVNEGVIRSWEIGKSEPRDPISIHMLLGEIEDAALDCVDELIESVDDENEGRAGAADSAHRVPGHSHLSSEHAMGNAAPPTLVPCLRRARIPAPLRSGHPRPDRHPLRLRTRIMTTEYLGTAAVAERLGLAVPTIRSYILRGLMPAPDVIISTPSGPLRGWAPETIAEWPRARAGRGRHSRTAAA